MAAGIWHLFAQHKHQLTAPQTEHQACSEAPIGLLKRTESMNT